MKLITKLLVISGLLLNLSHALVFGASSSSGSASSSSTFSSAASDLEGFATSLAGQIETFVSQNPDLTLNTHFVQQDMINFLQRIVIDSSLHKGRHTAWPIHDALHSQEGRQAYSDSFSSLPTHTMHLTTETAQELGRSANEARVRAQPHIIAAARAVETALRSTSQTTQRVFGQTLRHLVTAAIWIAENRPELTPIVMRILTVTVHVIAYIARTSPALITRLAQVSATATRLTTSGITRTTRLLTPLALASGKIVIQSLPVIASGTRRVVNVNNIRRTGTFIKENTLLISGIITLALVVWTAGSFYGRYMDRSTRGAIRYQDHERPGCLMVNPDMDMCQELDPSFSKPFDSIESATLIALLCFVSKIAHVMYHQF
ncbi:hypothetical protein K2X40_03195 [Candidatus Babeliales bacterium]|nr:hypothetical protein [Candidatus Babeliales bacterium]